MPLAVIKGLANDFNMLSGLASLTSMPHQGHKGELPSLRYCTPFLMRLTKSKKNIRLLHLRGLFFPVDQTSPRPEYFPTVVSDFGRFPVIDGVISKNPDNHITWRETFVQAREAEVTFALFCRTGGAMAVNSSIANLDQRICFKGDIVVMKVGKREDFIHLRSARDKCLALAAVKRFTRTARSVTAVYALRDMQADDDDDAWTVSKGISA
ncbi:hypothetical protein JOM56_014318 [Amanita muscaria]